METNNIILTTPETIQALGSQLSTLQQQQKECEVDIIRKRDALRKAEALMQGINGAIEVLTGIIQKMKHQDTKTTTK